jgi:hypothetical protein
MMPSSDERMLILRMVEEGKISAEDATRLMGALGTTEGEAQPEMPEPEPTPMNNGRQLHVRVSNGATGKQKVNVNIPLGLVDVGLRFVPASANIDVAAIRNALRSGMTGRIVDVVDEEKGDRVEVFIE